MSGDERVELMRETMRVAPPPSPLDDVLLTVRDWLHFPSALLFYLIVAAVLANRMDEGDPVWVIVVGGSSRGKTEVLMSLEGLDYVRVVGSLTEAALLSGTPKKERAANASGGLLRELPSFGATIVVKDFGAVLTLPRDRRAVVVQALRDVYDGRYVRDVGTGGGQRLEWHGRLGFIGGATGALDTHGVVMAALGERWLTLRLPVDHADDNGEGDEMKMALRALAGGKTRAMREALSEKVGGYIAALEPPELVRLDEVDSAFVAALSVFVARARSPVERDQYGSREIEAVPQGEGPGRFARQLHKLTLCLYAIGLDRATTHTAIRNLALDSIPPSRKRALDLLLANDERVSTAVVATTIGLPTNTARRVLEDLAAHRLLDRRKADQRDNAPHEWWASPSTRALWEAIQNPHGQVENGVPEMSHTPLLREREYVEEDFSGTRSDPPQRKRASRGSVTCSRCRESIAKDDPRTVVNGLWVCADCLYEQERGASRADAADERPERSTT